MTTDPKKAKQRYKAVWRAANPNKVRCAKAKYRRDHADRIAAYDRQKKDSHQRVIDLFKLMAGCNDCSTRYGELHFHHLDPTTKSFVVSQGFAKAPAALAAEIAKCVIVCEPCHHARHRAMRAA